MAGDGLLGKREPPHRMGRGVIVIKETHQQEWCSPLTDARPFGRSFEGTGRCGTWPPMLPKSIHQMAPWLSVTPESVQSPPLSAMVPAGEVRPTDFPMHKRKSRCADPPVSRELTTSAYR